jgi:hypothetical protein
MQEQECKTPSASSPTMAFWDRSVGIFKSIRDYPYNDILTWFLSLAYCMLPEIAHLSMEAADVTSMSD